MSTADRSKTESWQQADVGKGGAGNPGGFPAGSSILMLSAKVSKGSSRRPSGQRPGWRRGRRMLEDGTPRPCRRWRLGSSHGNKDWREYLVPGPISICISSSKFRNFLLLLSLPPSTVFPMQDSRPIFFFFNVLLLKCSNRKKFEGIIQWTHSYHLDSTINILPYTCSITYLSIHLIFWCFSKLQTSVHFTSKPFTMLIIDLSSVFVSPFLF